MASLGNFFLREFVKRVVLTLTFLFFVSIGHAQIITTVAGNGTGGFSGDGGPATSAMLNDIDGMAADGLGNLYIVDSSNGRIRRVDKATGIITTVAGNGSTGYAGDGGSALDAEFNQPTAVAFDATGNLYICDTGNSVIRKVVLVAP